MTSISSSVESLKVLYEDNHLIAVYKPAGMLVQGDETGDESLMDAVKDYLKVKYSKPGDVFLGLLHRLDRPVSGIVLFAKTSKGASRISAQFRERTIKKTYHATVEGIPAESTGVLIDWLYKDGETNYVSVMPEGTEGALRAELSYRVLNVDAVLDQSVLEIIPVTGRPHQIRVQLEHLGCPIAGDVKYGAKRARFDKTIGLEAVELAFEAATGGEKVVVKAK